MIEIDFKALAADWSWLIELDDYELVDISPFGDLLLESRGGTLCLLDINQGILECPSADSPDPAVLFPYAFDGRLATKYRQGQIFLKQGTCYGYKIQTVIGGSFEIENVYVANLAEYVSLMGSFHVQIKDIPDGQKVRIVVK